MKRYRFPALHEDLFSLISYGYAKPQNIFPSFDISTHSPDFDVEEVEDTNWHAQLN